MQEGKPEDPGETCESKYELETISIYSACSTGNWTRAQWCLAPGITTTLPASLGGVTYNWVVQCIQIMEVW